MYISEEKYEEIKNKFGVPCVGDMLLTSVGTIGIPYIVKSTDKFYFKDGNLTWFKNFNNKLLSKYLFYWICSPKGAKTLYNTTIGSSQKALTIAALKNIEIELPALEIQNKIVSILSAYDDLIENNKKQIKLLEEAAQRLYKEWFVDLRFPGYETTPIIDGVPEGWETCAIQDLCEKVNAGGTPKRENLNFWNNGTIKWYKTGELKDLWLIDSEEHISVDGLESSSAKLFPKNTIIMAIYASPTLGRLGILSTNGTCNQAALCFVANEKKYHGNGYIKNFMNYGTSLMLLQRVLDSKI